jgi:hypothetical protein
VTDRITLPIQRLTKEEIADQGGRRQPQEPESIHSKQVQPQSQDVEREIPCQRAQRQPPIVVPPGASSVQIAPDGTVAALTGNSTQVLGQLTLIRFPNPPGLIGLRATCLPPRPLPIIQRLPTPARWRQGRCSRAPSKAPTSIRPRNSPISSSLSRRSRPTVERATSRIRC